MAKDSTAKEQAKALYIQGVAIAEIARRGIAARRTIQRWMDADRAAGNDWEALRSSLPQPEPPPRPKVVNFDRPRSEPTARPVPVIASGDYATAEGLLAAIDEAIVMARVELAAPTVPQNFGAAISGLCKLIDQRLKVAPLDDEALCDMLLARYKTPTELIKRLRASGWGAG